MDTAYTILDAVLGLSATKAEQLNTAQMCVRAIVTFLVLIAYVRIGKKRFLGSATAFDAILVIIIGSISSRAISGNAPFVASLAATLVLILVHWAFSYFAQSSPIFSNLIKGRDTVIIRNGRVDRKALRAAHMSEDDLDEDLRQQGVGRHSDVAEARLERSGKLSVIKNE